MTQERPDLFVFHAKTRSYIIPRLNKALERRCISASEVSTLIIVNDRPGCSIKDICEGIAADKGIMTNRVKRLISEGLIENRSEDKRRYSLHLTEKGRTEHDYAREELWKLNEALMVNLTERQKETFLKLMSKIEDIADLGYRYRGRPGSSFRTCFETVRMKVSGSHTVLPSLSDSENVSTSTRTLLAPSSVRTPTSHCGLLSLLKGRPWAMRFRTSGSPPWLVAGSFLLSLFASAKRFSELALYSSSYILRK